MPDPTESSGTTARCGNCGETAGPRFCPQCGQEVEARHGPLWEVCREFLSEWLLLDSKLLRSLRALVHPARLSELYLGGKRAPFLRPFRLYLVASVVLFSTVLTLEPPDPTDLDLYIGGQLVGSEIPGEVADSVEFKVGPKTGKVTNRLEFLDDTTLVGRLLVDLAGDRIGRLRTLPREQVVKTLFLGLRRMLPLALILFVPLLALGLKILYIRRRAQRYLYLDHLVFAVHFQAELFFALSASWLVTRLSGLEMLGSVIAGVIVFVAILFVYLPLALRRFYGQSLLWTALKAFTVLFLYHQLLGLVINVSALAAIWGA